MKLETSYLGFVLEHPVVPGACPLTGDLDHARRLEDAGAPMLVMPSLFEEEVRHDAFAPRPAGGERETAFDRALAAAPGRGPETVAPEDYLDQVYRLKQAVGVPVVASLNGATLGGWLRQARAIEDAGADALEINLYRVATSFNVSARELEAEHIRVVEELKKQTTLPLAVKLSPYYTSLPNIAAHLVRAGAEAVVVFNRFYQPELDLETLELDRKLDLSTSAELNLRLRWLAILSGRLPAKLAATGGVHGVEDVVKAVLCGADVCQVASTLLLRGPQRIGELAEGLSRWLDDRGYASLEEARGSKSVATLGETPAYARANYFHLLRGWRRGDD